MNGPSFTARITNSDGTQADAVIMLEGSVIGGVTMTRGDDGWLTQAGAPVDCWADMMVQSFLNECESDVDCFYTRSDLVSFIESAVNAAAASA